MKNLILLMLFITSVNLYSQLLRLDYRSPEKKESQFKISLFKQYMLGVNTLGHLDLSGEVMSINYSGSSGFMGGLSVMGTTTLFYSNDDDKKNNLTHLLNPIGGINGSLYFLFALQKKEKSSLKLSSRLGIKWIQGSALKGFENYFLSRYGALGSVYQRILFEDALENQRIDFWIYPHLMASQVGEENLKIFFDNQLETISYGYGLQTGVEFNLKVRLIFLLNQFINPINSDALGNPVLRLILSYRF
mgnify:FL=1